MRDNYKDQLCKFTCQNCGFTDYVTNKQWECGSSGGVWAFRWWNGTDIGDYCICPKCQKEIKSTYFNSGHYGMAVVWSEENMSS